MLTEDLRILPAGEKKYPTNSGRFRVLFTDHLNIARGKYISQEMAKHGEANFCVGTFGLTYNKDLLPAPHSYLLEGLPDVQARFEPFVHEESTNTNRFGWFKHQRIAIADLYMRGEPYAACGRGALKRALAAWENEGYDVGIGVELEAYIFARHSETGEWVPYDSPSAHVYGTGPLCEPSGVTELLWHAAERFGISIESMNSEFDSPQMELTLHYRPALEAIDESMLFRLLAREIFHQQGLLLTFMPKPIEGISGSGVHMNFSFKPRNAQARPLFNRAGEMMLAKRVIAGMLAHHKGLAGLLCPTVNSYQRAQPAQLAGYWANWGFDHRSVTVRVPQTQGPAARIEHRLADGGANPYTAAAALLQASLLGDPATLPPHETQDGLENVSTDQHIATDLGAALDDLAADKALGAAVGEGLIANHIDIKRAEIAEVPSNLADQFKYYSRFL